MLAAAMCFAGVYMWVEPVKRLEADLEAELRPTLSEMESQRAAVEVYGIEHHKYMPLAKLQAERAAGKLTAKEFATVSRIATRYDPQSCICVPGSPNCFEQLVYNSSACTGEPIDRSVWLMDGKCHTMSDGNVPNFITPQGRSVNQVNGLRILSYEGFCRYNSMHGTKSTTGSCGDPFHNTRIYRPEIGTCTKFVPSYPRGTHYYVKIRGKCTGHMNFDVKVRSRQQFVPKIVPKAVPKLRKADGREWGAMPAPTLPPAEEFKSIAAKIKQAAKTDERTLEKRVFARYKSSLGPTAAPTISTEEQELQNSFSQEEGLDDEKKVPNKAHFKCEKMATAIADGCWDSLAVAYTKPQMNGNTCTSCRPKFTNLKQRCLKFAPAKIMSTVLYFLRQCANGDEVLADASRLQAGRQSINGRHPTI